MANAEKENLKIEHERASNEVEALKLDNDKYRRWVKNMITMNDKIKEDGADPELKKAVKKLEDDVKAKSKALEASEKARKDLLKKVEQEVLIRGNLEADKERLTKTVDALTKLVDLNATAEPPKNKTKCRDVDKPGGCPRAGACRFYHPEVFVAKDKKNIDCVHWMNGKCKFTDKICHFKHDEDKKGIRTTKRKRSEDAGLNSESEKVDFLQGLVRTLAQGPAAEARLGSPGGPAWGLESHRNTRPRMVSPEQPSRGMEGQRGNSSYGSRGMEDPWGSRTFFNSQNQEQYRQEHIPSSRNLDRQSSPARGLDVEGLLGQLRGLEQSIVQQQAGRR